MNTISICFTEEQLGLIVQVFEMGRTNAEVAAEHAENDWRTPAQIMTDYDTLYTMFDSAREVLVLRARARILTQIVEELDLEDLDRRRL